VIKPPRAVEAELFPESHAIDDLIESHPLLGDVDGQSLKTVFMLVNSRMPIADSSRP
jgi:hypothetical protein